MLFVVGAPSLHLLTERSIPTWKEYYTSFRDLFLLLARADTNYMWPFILVSFPVGFVVCEVIFWFNNWVGLHDDLDITGGQTDNEYFHTTIFIQRHEPVTRIYRWESFQSNLFLCTEFALEFFLAFHLTANLVIGIVGTISEKITLDTRNVIPVALTLLFAFLMYLIARHARKKKFIAFKAVYKTICELKAQEEAKESTSSNSSNHENLQTIRKPVPHSSEPQTEFEEKP